MFVRKTGQTAEAAAVLPTHLRVVDNWVAVPHRHQTTRVSQTYDSLRMSPDISADIHIRLNGSISQ